MKNCSSGQCFTRAYLNGKIVSDSWPKNLKEYEIKSNDDLSFEIVKFNQSQATLKIHNNKTAAVSLFATFESEKIPGYFSDNAFTLLPGQSKTVIFRAKTPMLHKNDFVVSLKSYN